MRNIGLVLYLVAVVFVSVIFLCGDAKSDTILGRVTYFCQVSLPHGLKSGIRKIPVFGPSFIDKGGRLLDYVINQRNPLMQILYLSLVLGGSGIYFIWFSHLVPNKIVGEQHVYLPYAAVSLVMYTFYLACTRDPGFITPETYHKYDHQKYDGLLYVKNKCDTCGLRKIARSKHCKLCNKCVARFDHHCPWVNICVGEDNLRFFLAFVTSTTGFLFYGVFVLGGTVYANVLRSGLLERDFIVGNSGNKIIVDKWLIAQYVGFKFPVMMGLLVLCLVMGIVLVGFFGYHLSLIYTGTTTNESSKWDTVSYFYRNKKRCIQECERELEKMRAEGKEPRNIPKEDLLNPNIAPPLSNRMPLEFPAVRPKNIYDLGFRNNLARVLAPSLFQNRSAPAAAKAKVSGAKGKKNRQKKKAQ